MVVLITVHCRFLQHPLRQQCLRTVMGHIFVVTTAYLKLRKARLQCLSICRQPLKCARHHTKLLGAYPYAHSVLLQTPRVI